jgi:SAM-dependent methyltransferase
MGYILPLSQIEMMLKFPTRNERIDPWSDWAKWLSARNAKWWLVPSVQDEFYRHECLEPQLVRAILNANHSAIDFVELGCGSGKYTQSLLQRLRIAGADINTVTLVDRSAFLLRAARARLAPWHPTVITCDLSSIELRRKLERRSSSPPRVFLAEFVFQELSNLSAVLATLSHTMSSADRLYFVVPASSFVELLRNRPQGETLLKIQRGARCSGNHAFRKPSTADWFWAAKYPIRTDEGVFHVPYFHRKERDLARIVRRAALHLEMAQQVIVPRNSQTLDVFKDTPYRNAIFNNVSSNVIMLSTQKRSIHAKLK